MREIKFRAWVYSAYEIDGNTFSKPVMFLNVQDFYDGNANWSKELKYTGNGFDTFGDVIESTKSHPDPKGNFKVIDIMQYTGLKDKNGKEIYEGDILDDGKGIGVVHFKAPSFIVCNPSGEWYLGSGLTYPGNLNVLKDTEVKGNIYENPELIGK